MKAVETVFDAIHRGDADPKLLAHQYLQVLPPIAHGASNRVWIVPSEFVQRLGRFVGELGPGRSGDDDEAPQLPC